VRIQTGIFCLENVATKSFPSKKKKKTVKNDVRSNARIRGVCGGGTSQKESQ
jgi:hypothetical protein